jgi:two-component system chemotaxis response regulator CheY
MDNCKAAVHCSNGILCEQSRISDSDAIKRKGHKRQKTVAIIEDERDIVDVYIRLCLMKCLDIAFIAYDGSDAVDKFMSCARPDVLLIDHRMPTMTGLEAMEKMLEVDPLAKFIVISADDEIKEEALGAGARVFIKKPASLCEISLAITKVLNEP